ncbi:winged helix-turn-helix domain-containing protein [Streptomyces sp. ISL-10]|uniref:winged helix-turn-helix domain-containing protein n=1 Tax=Streptomyces sp. ISL-10 TaxID=2819172 RepID=UPI0027E5939E|nr:winged helix-turn-helix domain-containing protein [Streptomyces sp. ISL-10]
MLLGRTRAAVLDALADPSGHTTKQLAQRLNISPTSASEHATALRAVGLVTTLRQANTVRHTTTPLGTNLLSTGRAGPSIPDTARSCPAFIRARTRISDRERARQ